MTPEERTAALDRLSRGFMVPNVWRGDVWEVQANHGETHYVPADVVGSRVAAAVILSDYVEGTIDTDDEGNPIAELKRDMWMGRLSAPGYMDATDLVIGDSREDVEDQLIDAYDDGEEDNKEPQRTTGGYVVNDPINHPEDFGGNDGEDL
jgi:hypothetical protein